MTEGSKRSQTKPATGDAPAKRPEATDPSGERAGPSDRAAPSKKRAEASLDDALDDTFPASDPVSPKHIT